MTTEDVKVGQLWRDKDKRMSNGNRVRVVREIIGYFVLMGHPSLPNMPATRVRTSNLLKRWRLEP